MEENREDKMLSDLFRHKLENAEITPSPTLGDKLMRGVGRREFLRFNPSRMNIWYAGAAAAAGTALTLILTQAPGEKAKENKENAPVEINKEFPVNNPEKDVAVPVIDIRTERQNVISGKKAAKNKITETNAVSKPGVNTREVAVTQAEETQKVSNLPAAGNLGEPAIDGNKLRSNNQVNSLIEASVTGGCSPLKVSFRSIAGPGDTCAWDFGDGGHSSIKNPVWLFDNAGEYKVTLQVTGSGLKSSSSVVIKVFPEPLARFDISPENAILPRDEISFHNYSEGAEKYRWDFGDGTGSDAPEPHHSYRKYGNYNVRLIAISEFGCSDSLVIYNAFSSSGCFIEFPNAFIPNVTGPSGGYYSQKSDETSQIFHPVYSGIADYQLRIFTKRGILVFETNDINYGWDGYYKGQLCDPGVYVWKVRGNFINSEQFTKVGDVTLLKN